MTGSLKTTTYKGGAKAQLPTDCVVVANMEEDPEGRQRESQWPRESESSRNRQQHSFLKYQVISMQKFTGDRDTGKCE